MVIHFLTSSFHPRLIRGTHFFEGKITLNPRFFLRVPFRPFYKNDLIFKKFLSPSPGHFYNLTKNCARRPTFLASLVEISPCKDVCSSLHAEIKTACKEERTSLHAGISSAPARRLVCGAQITVRSKKCPGEGKRNFKKFQEISRYFKRVSKKNQSVSSCPDSLFQTPHYNLEILRS